VLYGIFGDVHGNYDALVAVLRYMKRLKISQLICLGDVVGYGAEPNECVEAVRSAASICVAGNHDYAALGKGDAEAFNPWAREAILWTRDQLTQENKDYLESLPLTGSADDFEVVHATLQDPDSFPYIESSWDAAECFKLMKKPIVFVGHTHVPINFLKTSEAISWDRGQHVRRDHVLQAIVNIGSVGQPRDNNPKAAFATYDPDEGMVSIHRITYDVRKAFEKIYSAGLPSILAERLFVGR